MKSGEEKKTDLVPWLLQIPRGTISRSQNNLTTGTDDVQGKKKELKSLADQLWNWQNDGRTLLGNNQSGEKRGQV